MEMKEIFELGKILSDKSEKGIAMCKALEKNEYDIEKAEKYLKEKERIRVDSACALLK